MKRQILLLLAVVVVAVTAAQQPNGFSYQAVLRSSSGQVLANQSVTLRLSLTDEAGTTVHYAERHAVQTDVRGIVNLVVGNGTVVSGSFSQVPWPTGGVFLKVELSTDGGSTYTALGSQALQAVPYALVAGNGLTWLGSLASPPADPQRNQAYYNTTDRRSYLWDGDSWEVVAQDGAQGPQGPQGLPGPVGPQGPQGVAGVGLNNRGAWVAGTKYGPNDYVFAENTPQTGNTMWILQASDSVLSTVPPREDLANWVEFEAPAGPQGEPGVGLQWLGSLLSPPADPQRNQAYYSLTDRRSYVWDGDSWEVLAQDGAPGASGMVIPGTAGQTIVHDGTGWVASSKITVNADTVGIGTASPLSKLVVRADASASAEDPIFEVRNREGKVVLAVYNEGVRVYVADDPQGKGRKGGFAVGGLVGGKTDPVEYLRVTPDSTRVMVRELTGKGAKGGFAVGGLVGGKGTPYQLMFIAPDSARIYVRDSLQTKGRKGGFAVGGLTNEVKGQLAGRYLDMTPQNYFVGHEAGKSNTTGLYNSFFGYQAGFNNTEGSSNLLLGYQSGYNNTIGSYNTFVGYLAGNQNTTGVKNTFSGSYAGSKNVSGNNNTFFGFRTGANNLTGESNSFIGTESGYSNTSGNHNVFIGTESGYSNITGNFNSFLGYHTGRSNVKGNYNVFIGYEAGLSSDSSYNTFIGYQSGRSNTEGRNNNFIGYQAGYLHIGGGIDPNNNNNPTGRDNNFIGTRAGYGNLKGYDNVFIGSLAGYSNNGSENTFVGTGAGAYSSTGSSTLVGWCAGQSNDGRHNVFIGPLTGGSSNGLENTYLGAYAGYDGDGRRNILIGMESGKYIKGDDNICFGKAAGARGWDLSNPALIYGNVFIGNSCAANYVTGNYNICIGYQTAQYSSGAQNVLIGGFAGQNAGSGNVMIGYMAGKNESGTNKLYISNSDANASNALIYGEFDNKVLCLNANVGVGTTSPGAKLDIFQIAGPSGANRALGLRAGNASNYYGNHQIVLGYDQTLNYAHSIKTRHNSGSGTGNAIDFFTWKYGDAASTIGGQHTMTLENGNVGIGTTSPGNYKLYVNGGDVMVNRGDGLGGNIKIAGHSFVGSADWGDLTLAAGQNSGNAKINFVTENAVRMYIIGNGNVGIGTFPSQRLHVAGGNAVVNNVFIGDVGHGATFAGFAHSSSASANGYALLQSSDGYYTFINKKSGSGYIGFRIENVDNMVINNAGNVGIGTTSPSSKLHVSKNLDDNIVYFENGNNTTSAGSILIKAGSNTAGGAYFLRFWRADGTPIGGIQQSTATTIAYNTSSDIRLKENISPTRYSINDLMKIEVKDFNYIKDESKTRLSGFIAQELYKIYPEAVTKGVSESDIWQVDYGRISPLLVKAIQDQQHQIQILEQRNAILEQKLQEMDALKARLEALEALLKNK